MSFEIKVSLKDEAVKKKLQELLTKVSDTKPLLNQIGHTLIDQTEENFEDESFFGKPWTISKRAELEGGKTLQDTARLASSIDYEVSGSKLTVGTNVEYAAIHQFGGKAGRGKKTVIEAREFLPIDSDTKELPKESEDEILEVVMSFFT
ncbi:phage virion morphogenesis protein [Hydrogenimonas thermophila]|uniref:Phage virion morphogenesis (Putative tail completion) protein n=1 Tax=Hydrogenimonas thermophila TaxID=223786 RepID=A0A1I5RQX5_9BACT|nr:phage virion morphogenesis protein [Hydrogenimonas thermophila]SFP60942.1 phage virion morphogenesis (putative tail completion) protein [Hydrogenimonas thermophila]